MWELEEKIRGGLKRFEEIKNLRHFWSFVIDFCKYYLWRNNNITSKILA